MSTIVFPSLSTDGYIEDRNIIIKKILEMFVASDENQSNFFSVKSYKYIVNSHDAGFSVSDEIKKALVDMYSHFFETTTVEVGSTFKEEDSMYLYTISVSAVYAGRIYTLTKDISESIVIKE